MSPEKLAYMANQIGRFFAHQPHERAVADTEDHLRKFWDPRMRATITTQFDAICGKLEPVAREAVERLRQSR
jgi:formate dehydrogenase subunit delta